MEDSAKNFVEVSSNKPAWDGREGFSKKLVEYLDYLAQAQLNSDFSAWIRLLNTYFSLVNPYIDDKAADELEKLFEKTQKDYVFILKGCMADTISMNNFDVRLQKLTRQLIKASKHLLLPTSEDSDDFSESAFFEGTV